jgi:hypothetical protein
MKQKDCTLELNRDISQLKKAKVKINGLHFDTFMPQRFNCKLGKRTAPIL